MVTHLFAAKGFPTLLVVNSQSIQAVCQSLSDSVSNSVTSRDKVERLSSFIHLVPNGNVERTVQSYSQTILKQIYLPREDFHPCLKCFRSEFLSGLATLAVIQYIEVRDLYLYSSNCSSLLGGIYCNIYCDILLAASNRKTVYCC